MTIKLPRDFEGLNSYRKFVRALAGNEVLALYAFTRLWIELGYQVEAHGESGVFKFTEVETFKTTLKLPDPDTIFQALIDSGMLVPSGSDWVCPLFAHQNVELDSSFVPFNSTGRAIRLYEKQKRDAEKKAPTLISTLAPECWHKEDGTMMTPSEMNRCIVLIRTIDSVLKFRERPAEQFTPAMLNDACRVITMYSDDKLTVVMRRLYIKRGAGCTRSTEFYLRNFEDIVARIMPDDGYLKWARRHGLEK